MSDFELLVQHHYNAETTTLKCQVYAMLRFKSSAKAKAQTTQSKSSNNLRWHYQAACPPSIRISLPVIKLLASLIKNTAAPRYSSGLLNLPSIFCVGQSRLLSGNCSKSASTMAVTMYPGEMVLTRMPY
jgi:hypothetical protein